MSKSKEWFPDPEFTDENNDPEFKLEMFATYRYTGTKPEELIDPELAAEYAEWLKTAPTDEEQ